MVIQALGRKPPKIVPLTHGNNVCGARCIARTLRLTPEDVCVNIMPLFHIHGLAVNVLASLLAGAAVICDARLDPMLFYSRVLGKASISAAPATRASDFPPAATWYSAVPTMHHGIITMGEPAGQSPCFLALEADRALPPADRRLRLEILRNCSAALLPALSARAEKIFEASSLGVVATYAMTESMPIASNPRDDGRCQGRNRVMVAHRSLERLP